MSVSKLPCSLPFYKFTPRNEKVANAHGHVVKSVGKHFTELAKGRTTGPEVFASLTAHSTPISDIFYVPGRGRAANMQSSASRAISSMAIIFRAGRADPSEMPTALEPWSNFAFYDKDWQAWSIALDDLAEADIEAGKLAKASNGIVTYGSQPLISEKAKWKRFAGKDCEVPTFAGNTAWLTAEHSMLLELAVNLEFFVLDTDTNTDTAIQVKRHPVSLWFGSGDELARNPEYPNEIPLEVFTRRTFSVEVTKATAPAQGLGKLSYTPEGEIWLIPVAPGMLRDSTFGEEKTESNMDFVLFRNSHPYADPANTGLIFEYEPEIAAQHGDDGPMPVQSCGLREKRPDGIRPSWVMAC